jgi:hypothetical protein
MKRRDGPKMTAQPASYWKPGMTNKPWAQQYADLQRVTAVERQIKIEQEALEAQMLARTCLNAEIRQARKALATLLETRDEIGPELRKRRNKLKELRHQREHM